MTNTREKLKKHMHLAIPMMDTNQIASTIGSIAEQLVCKFFNWDMPLKNSMVTERSIACKRMDGGHEIVPGYHNID